MSGSNREDNQSDGGDGSDDQYHFAHLPIIRDPFQVAEWKAGQWYAKDRGIEYTVVNSEFDAAKQHQDAINLINTGVDALIVGVVDPNASKRFINTAAENNVPVFTADHTSHSPKVKLFTAFGNYNAAVAAAHQIAKRLKDAYGEPKGRVLELVLPQTLSTLVARHKGFVETMKEYPDIEIVGSVATKPNESQAQTNTINFLRSTSDIDALYAPSIATGLGAASALEKMGMLKKKGEPGHVVFVQLDAGPRVIDNIKQGYVDLAVDQPNLFYVPISIKYAIDYLDAGHNGSVLPDIGQKMTSNDLNIEGSKHAGVHPWRKPLWAPANIVPYKHKEKTFHPWFKTSEVLVDQSNADAPYLWGNIARNF